MHQAEHERHRGAQARGPLGAREQCEVAAREQREARENEGSDRSDPEHGGTCEQRRAECGHHGHCRSAPAEQPCVLGGDQRDRITDQRLDRGAVRPHHAEHRERERHAVRGRERGDEHGHFAQPPREQEQREQEGEVVPARGDVDDAERDVPEERGAARRSRPRPARRLERPGGLRLREHALAHAGGAARDAREVEVRRRGV